MSPDEAASDWLLALKVLKQAFLDASAVLIEPARAQTHTWPLAKEQREAQRFLLAPEGEWAEALQHRRPGSQ